MLLYNVNSRAAAVIRLVGLTLICWSVATAGHGLAVAGRGLVVAVLLAVAAVAWLAWAAAPTGGRMLAVALFVLAGAGGVLTAAASASVASAFVFAAVVAGGVRFELPRAGAILAVGVLGLAVGVLIYDRAALGLLAYALGFAAALLAGANGRQSMVRAEQAELLLAQTQRSREEQLRVARLEESARIAREIHDVLAHALAGLSIHLEATRALVEQGAERDIVLARVERAHGLAREGLEETRSAVGALRGETALVADALEALLSEYRSSAGDAQATITIDGDRSRLTGPNGLAIMRVVQEALTNVRKHAPGADVSVALRAGTTTEEEMVLVVSDRAVSDRAISNHLARASVAIPASGDALSRPLAEAGGGYGLRGMRERAQILGGTLEAGPVEDGWRVELRLPPPGKLRAEGDRA